MTTRSASLPAAARLACTDGLLSSPIASRRAWLRASIALFFLWLKNHRMAGMAKKEAAYACSNHNEQAYQSHDSCSLCRLCLEVEGQMVPFMLKSR